MIFSNENNYKYLTMQVSYRKMEELVIIEIVISHRKLSF